MEKFKPHSERQIGRPPPFSRAAQLMLSASPSVSGVCLSGPVILRPARRDSVAYVIAVKKRFKPLLEVIY